MELLRYGFVPSGNDCGYCENLLCEGDDDYVCKATNELLDIKNSPCVYDGVYCLFNYVPCPSKLCPKGRYKAEKTNG